MEDSFEKEDEEPGLTSNTIIGDKNGYTTVINGLPRYDENGEPYEYILLEYSNIYATYENSVDEVTGNYTSTVTNHIGPESEPSGLWCGRSGTTAATSSTGSR